MLSIGNSFLFPLLSAPFARATSSAASSALFELPPIVLRFRLSVLEEEEEASAAAAGLIFDLRAFQLLEGAAGVLDGAGVDFLAAIE